VTYAREEKKLERRGEVLVGRFRVGWTLFETPGYSRTLSVAVTWLKKGKEQYGTPHGT
jgi:hypothetical protein